MPREFADGSLYMVVSGDTCDSIAQAHACSLDELLGANAGLIVDPSFIQIGWELIIPGKLTGNRREAPPVGDGVALYSIESGDTLGALAARWETTVPAARCRGSPTSASTKGVFRLTEILPNNLPPMLMRYLHLCCWAAP